jgi:16S rRNA (uracil1498-N3)-methyltransferase
LKIWQFENGLTRLAEMNIFYAPDINFPDITLSPEESAHCIRVLRLGRGEHVQVIDGNGGYYNAVITTPDARCCKLKVTETIPGDVHRNYTVHIAIAPTKNMDRFEWFVEKSVEIGIDMITPLLCHHSERKVLKTERLERLIISTMKQAIIPTHPVLHELTGFKEFVSLQGKNDTDLFIAHCEETDRKKLVTACTAGRNTLVLIGPEGDFSRDEIRLAVSHRFIPVSLGNNRLRTETAGIAACHTVNLVNQK